MFVNNRFVKSKFEKPNDNLKLNHENIINVLFYSEKNLLLSDGLSNEKNLAKFLKKIIENNSASTCIVRSERGIFLLINRKDHKSDLTNKYLEDLGGSIFNQTKSIGCSEVRIFEHDQYLNKQIALGILLSSYKFNNYKKNKTKYTVDIKNITFICDEPKKHSQNIQEIKNIANGVFTARDLVWQPPNILFPSSFANECKKLKKIGVNVTIYNENQLKKLGMEALLAVGRGKKR